MVTAGSVREHVLREALNLGLEGDVNVAFNVSVDAFEVSGRCAGKSFFITNKCIEDGRYVEAIRSRLRELA